MPTPLTPLEVAEVKKFLPETTANLESMGYRMVQNFGASVNVPGFGVLTVHELIAEKPLFGRVLIQTKLPSWAEVDDPVTKQSVWLPKWMSSNWIVFLTADNPSRSVVGERGHRSWKIRWGPNFIEGLKRREEFLIGVAQEVSKVPPCPHCGGLLVKRAIQQGDRVGQEFYGCTNYPSCLGMSAPWKQTEFPLDGKLYESILCPSCSGSMVLRYVKKEGPKHGQRFFGCRKYPECKGTLDEAAAFGAKLMESPPPEKEKGFDPWS